MTWKKNPFFFIINHAVISIIRKRENNACDVMLYAAPRETRTEDKQTGWQWDWEKTRKQKKRSEISKWKWDGGEFFTSHILTQHKGKFKLLYIGLKISIWITCIIDALHRYVSSQLASCVREKNNEKKKELRTHHRKMNTYM